MREKKKKNRFTPVKKKFQKPKLPITPSNIDTAGEDVRVISTLPSAQPTTSYNTNNISMPNSIAFSSDMTKLYLIDCDRNICFDLVNSNGVMVSTVKGQIFAVSAATPRAAKVDGRKTKRLRLSTKNAQYTLIYNPDKVHMFVIGFDDIDGSLVIGDDTKPPIGQAFDIEDHVVIIRRVGNDLELDYSKR